MKLIKALFALIILVGVLGAMALGGGWVWLNNEIVKPGPEADAPHEFRVEQGEGLASVATRLEAEGVVRSARVVRLADRLDDNPEPIKFGRYEIPAGSSVAEVLAQLKKGEVVMYRITIPEGLTTAQVLRRIEADENLTGDMPETAPEEGELLPDTYTFEEGTSREFIIELMKREQDKLIDELWETRDPATPVSTKEEALILASVVQKEAAGADDYDLVASVFVNRLNRGIALQSDPTVHYGVNRGEPLYNRAGQRRTLLRSELDTDTPWNTYTRPGLPQTPIANPGRAAIEAVLNPIKTDYIFFVADGKGGHAFAKDLAEHNRNVRAYREYEAAEIARERAND